VRGLVTVAKREILSFFVSPVAYVILTVFLVLQGSTLWVFSTFFAQQPVGYGATYTPLTLFFGGTQLFYPILIILAALITMRLVAAERRLGTLEPLLTAPVTETQVVLGKFAAAMVFWLALWAPTIVYVFIMSNYGDVDWQVVGSIYLGVLCIGLWYMAIGLLMSALSPNQIVAAILTMMFLFGFFIFGIVEFIQTGEAREIFGYVSVWRHMEDFAKGVVDSRHLVFAVTLTGLALTQAVLVLRGDRERAGRGAQGVVYAVAGPLLLLAIVLMVNYLSFRHYERWDWTSQGFFTLSERSGEEMRALDRAIDFYLFLSEGEENYPEVRELLERYQAESELFAVHYVDPDREPSEYRVLAQRFGIAAAMLEDGSTQADVAAVAVSGDDRFTITRDDMVGMDLGSFDDESEPKIDVKAEQAITEAVVQLTSGEPTKVCVGRGHGEWALAGAGERSLWALKEELRRDNVELEEVELVGRDVPDACDALYVVGPLRAFGEEDADRLREYVDGGRGLLLALDPVLDRDRVEATGLERMLSALDVAVDRTVVLELDPARVLPPGNPAGPFIVVDYGEHRTTEVMRRLEGPTLFALARSVSADGPRATDLLRTSREAWGETDLATLSADEEPAAGPDDVAGPVSLGAAVELEAAGEGARAGRVVVLGDADWLMGEPLRDPRFANLELALGITGWLTERETLISVPPKQIDAEPMTITEDDLGNLAFRLSLLPLAVIVLGGATWWSRRS
jgi:ABC-2 type transport system permease protein